MTAAPQYFNSSQGRVAHWTTGSGPDLVLVHGTPASSHVWHRVIERLQSRWRVFAYDLPGYGLSDQFDGQDVRLRTQAKVLAELLRHWGLERPRLVGHDFGAATVMGAHLVEGCPVRDLVIADGVLLNPWGTPYSMLVQENIRVFEQIPPHIHAAAMTAHLRGTTSRHLTDAELAPLLAPWLGEKGQKAYCRQVAQYDHDYTATLEPLYPKVSVPLHLLWGEEDRWIPIAQGEQFHRLVPGSRFTRLPDAGHFLMLDCPNTVAALIGATTA
jgi:pimeloyl-ACP methyl ester carboxylesterase